MYGWMTRWLKGEGDGKPIPEPKHEVETPEDLACYPDGQTAGGVPVPADVRRAARRGGCWRRSRHPAPTTRRPGRRRR